MTRCSCSRLARSVAGTNHPANHEISLRVAAEERACADGTGVPDDRASACRALGGRCDREQCNQCTSTRPRPGSSGRVARCWSTHRLTARQPSAGNSGDAVSPHSLSTTTSKRPGGRLADRGADQGLSGGRRSVESSRLGVTDPRHSRERNPHELILGATALPGAAELGRAGIPNVIYLNELDGGNHFAAWKEPDDFTTEISAGCTSLR